MDVKTIIIVIIIILVITVSLLVLRYYQSRPDPKPIPTPGPVQCDQEQILEAYIRNSPNNGICPNFTNDFIVQDGNLYQKDFVVGTTGNFPGCCYFSNQPDQRQIFPNPPICVGNLDNRSFTDQELNQKPYSYNNGRIIYLTPVCFTQGPEQINPDPNCVAMIQFATEPGNINLYKLYIFDSSANTITNQVDFDQIVFAISGQCQTLTEIRIKQETVVLRENDKLVYKVDSKLLPASVTKIVELFEKNRMYPIPGSNPPLSALAASSQPNS